MLRQALQEFQFCKSTLKTMSDYDALLSWGDRIGLPASLMLNPGSLAHIIMSYDFKPRAKKIAYKYLRRLQRVDRFLVLTTAQKRFWEREIGISENSIDVVGGQVDITHFDPIYEGFKSRVAAYIKRIQLRREVPWTRSARTARVII